MPNVGCSVARCGATRFKNDMFIGQINASVHTSHVVLHIIIGLVSIEIFVCFYSFLAAGGGVVVNSGRR